MTSLSINRVIRGRYRLVSQLAVGGMGITYRAWDLRAGGPVVLKMPRQPKDDPDGSEFARLATRFAREVEVMRALGHDHIVPIVDHGDDEGVPFVAMRFLPGGALSDHRKKTPTGDWQPIPSGQLRTWLPSIAEALDFIHSQGVVHRDVKPANIFFDGFLNAFLGDFGIAKVVGDEAGLEKGQTLTATHLAIGTPEYMAPELLSPKAVADGRADQYALAISVYEMLSGHRPFTGTTAHIVIEHASHPVPPLDRKVLGLPPSLTIAIERALAKKAVDRFGSCTEFTRALLADVQMQPYEPGLVRLLCPGCRKVLRIPQSAGGRQGNCPSCKQFLEIAEDFSALWLKSEASLVAELPSTPSAAPLLGIVDTDQTAAGLLTTPSTLDFVPVSRPRSPLAVVARIFILTVLAACLGGLWTHWQWLNHHSQVMQRLGDEHERERTMHAADLRAATQEHAAAVEAINLQWKKRFSEAEQSWEENYAILEAAPPESESRPPEAIKQPTIGEPLSAQTVEGVDGVEPEAAHAETPQSLTNSVGIELKLLPSLVDHYILPTGAVVAFPRPSPVYIGIYEVTNAQWQRIMGSAPGRSLEDDRPVENVNWNDAQEFCKKLSSLPEERDAGRVYRLPSSREWEFACRGGTPTAYSFGDDESQLDAHGWFSENSDGDSHPVGMKKPNPWGFFDMHGNVSEWCSDTVTKKGSRRRHRAVCGGSRIDDADNCRSTRRYSVDPHLRSPSRGFRLAMSLPGEPSPKARSEPMPTSAEAATKPESLEAEVTEVSEEFNTSSTRIDTKDNDFWLVSTCVSEQRLGERLWLVNFEGDKEEAEQALGVIRHYGINERVTLSDFTGLPEFVYWLSDGRGPVGAFAGARDARTEVFDPTTLEVQGRRVIGRGGRKGSVDFVVGPFHSKELSEKVLEVIHFYGFTCQCSLGKRNAHFTYFFR